MKEKETRFKTFVRFSILRTFFDRLGSACVFEQHVMLSQNAFVLNSCFESSFNEFYPQKSSLEKTGIRVETFYAWFFFKFTKLMRVQHNILMCSCLKSYLKKYFVMCCSQHAFIKFFFTCLPNKFNTVKHVWVIFGNYVFS